MFGPFVAWRVYRWVTLIVQGRERRREERKKVVESDG